MVLTTLSKAAPSYITLKTTGYTTMADKIIYLNNTTHCSGKFPILLLSHVLIYILQKIMLCLHDIIHMPIGIWNRYM